MITEKELQSLPVKSLIFKFALPSVVALLVNCLYNIVDQIFIGNYAGYLGNAATSICLPIIIFGMALASCVSSGGSVFFSLQIGANHKNVATKIVGNVLVLLFIVSMFVSAVGIVFVEPMLNLFGATPEILPMAKSYTVIMLLGFPFMLFAMGVNDFVRADGNPRYAMISMVCGAVANLILDPIFIFYFDWGISGAGWASVLSEAISFFISVAYVFRFRFVKLSLRSLILSFAVVKRIFIYGISNFIVSSSISIQVILYNNSLKSFGAESIYGSNIPLSVYALISKVNQIFMAFAIGIGLGIQPVLGFNYGAKNYQRVKHTLYYGLRYVMIIGLVFSVFMELFPFVVVRLFGGGDELYYRFANFAFRVVFIMQPMIGMSVVISNFFRSIGKPWKAVVVAGSRFTVFFFPFLYILPKFFGIEGVLFASPVAEFVSVVFSLWLMVREINSMKRKIKLQKKIVL